MIKYEWLKIRVLIGLPGSGKSTYIQNTLDEYNAVFDDILSPEDITKSIEIEGFTYTLVDMWRGFEYHCSEVKNLNIEKSKRFA